MGRPSKSEQLARVSQTALAIERISDTIVNIAAFVTREGLTVASGIMIFRITGKVGPDDPAYPLRSSLIDALGKLRGMLLVEIPLLGIAPLGWIEPLVKYYESLLNTADFGTSPPGFAEVPLVERAEMVIMIPAILRTMFQMMQGLLTKG